MSSPLAPRPRPPPPGIYRAARALRRLGLIVFVLVIVFVAIVAVSAIQIVQSHPQVGTSSTAFEPNGTVAYLTSIHLSNPTFLAIQSFALHFRITNASGGLLIDDSTPATTVSGQSSAVIPVDVYLPLTAGDESLLTVNQYLEWHIWGNATYGYLFPVSLGVETNRSWGAPFANLTASVGTPTMVGGTLVAPVTLSFSNDAQYDDEGTIEFEVVSNAGATCATGSFDLNVPSDSSYNSTQNVPVTSGCDPAGGSFESQYLEGGSSIPLPSQRIP